MATPWDYVEAAAKTAGVEAPASDALNGIIMRLLMNPGEADRYLKGLQAMAGKGASSGRVDPWEIWAANQAQNLEKNQPNKLAVFREFKGEGPSGAGFAEPSGDFLTPLAARTKGFDPSQPNKVQEGILPMEGEGANLYLKPGAGPADDIGAAEQAFRGLMHNIRGTSPNYSRFHKQKNKRGE